MAEPYDPALLSALVVDDNHFQRGITTDILRTIGVGRVVQAATGAEGWDQFVTQNPSCVFLDWLTPPFTGLDLIRHIRQSEESPNRAAPTFLVSSGAMRSAVEMARSAGVNAFMRKPLSVSVLEVRLRGIISRPVKFIETATYSGPDRRRRDDPKYTGPRRRLSDQVESLAPEDEDVRIELAKARIAVLESYAMKVRAGDANSARRLFNAARELEKVAGEIEDGPLAHGAAELVRYLSAQGAGAVPDFEAMRTHIGALHQLVHLPNAMQAERTRVAQSLTRMVDKKLRQQVAQIA